MAWHLYAVAERPAGAGSGRWPALGPGLRGAAVEMVEWNDLAAAASPVDPGWEAEPGPPELEEHARVVMDLFRHGICLLPFRFGVTAPSRFQVAQLLELNQRELRHQLQRLRGTVEAAVVGFWEPAAVRAELLRALPARHPRAAAQYGALAEAVVQRWRERYTPLAAQAVERLAREVRVQRVLGVRMLFNLAVWLAGEQQAQLEEVVGRLRSAWRGRVRLRLTAPLPPFTFCEMALRSPTLPELPA